MQFKRGVDMMITLLAYLYPEAQARRTSATETRILVSKNRKRNRMRYVSITDFASYLTGEGFEPAAIVAFTDMLFSEVEQTDERRPYVILEQLDKWEEIFIKGQERSEAVKSTAALYHVRAEEPEPEKYDHSFMKFYVDAYSDLHARSVVFAMRVHLEIEKTAIPPVLI